MNERDKTASKEVRFDPLQITLCLIGAAILFELWRRGILSFDMIKYILTAGI
jgi:hypothetical protein